LHIQLFRGRRNGDPIWMPHVFHLGFLSLQGVTDAHTRVRASRLPVRIKPCCFSIRYAHIAVDARGLQAVIVESL
jgi:hypothetical protein